MKVSSSKTKDLTRLLNPRGIAIVGASDDALRIGGQSVNALSKFGYAGKVYPVNPTRTQVQGLKCFSSVTDVPHPCDLALIVLPAEGVPSVILQCGEAGIPFAIVLSAGFEETGNHSLQRKLEEAIKRSRVRVVGPNCVGILNLNDRVFNGFGAGFRNPDMRRGPVAMVTQSGGFGHSIVSLAEHEGIGVDYVVSTGNEVDLGSLDFVEHFLEDPKIELIFCFMEGISDGSRLRQLGARALEVSKPIVVWKVGNSRVGAKVAMSHTANLSSNYELYRAAFREGGFIEIGEVTDLVDVALAFLAHRHPAGRRVGILTTSGGAGVLLADKCEELGLELPALEEASIRALRDLLPGFAAVQNPLDLSGQASQNPEIVNKATNILLSDPNIDLGILRSLSGAAASAWVDGLIQVISSVGKPVLVSLSNPASKSEATIGSLHKAHIPSFQTPRRSAVAAAALVSFAAKCRAGPRTMPNRVMEMKNIGLLQDGATITERNAKALLSEYGIPMTREIALSVDEVDDFSHLPLSFPVAVKVDSPDLPHKTEAGAVRLGIEDLTGLKRAARAVIDATRKYAQNARVDGVLVQEMAQGLEFIVGGVVDPVFGPYVVVGMGGVTSEVLRDTALRFAPIDEKNAHDMIEEIKSARILHGYRGDKPYDIDALSDVLVKLSWFLHDHAERVSEVDINPLFVRHAGLGVIAADALIVCKA